MVNDSFFRRACLVAALVYIAAVTGWADDGKVRRDGFDLYYRTEGNGTPVVLLSGGPGSTSTT
jgi:proline iminopeptidase